MIVFKVFLLLAIAVPWLSGIAVWAWGKRCRELGGIIAALVSLSIFIASILLYPQVYGEHPRIIVNGFFMGNINFTINPLGYLFILLTTIVWFAASLFSVWYMSTDINAGRYYCFFLATLGATLGVFLSGDMIGLFAFFEVMSLSSFMLVIHLQSREAIEAGKLYLFMSIFGSLLALMGIFMMYHTAGTLEIAVLYGALSNAGKKGFAVYMLIMFGFGVKAGVVPFHIWLPRAHPAAPAPASAILSGVLLKTGIYGILIASRIFLGDGLPVAGAVMFLGAITMVVGALSAYKSSNLKRLLAYSSMSQMGYVILSIGSGLALGKAGWLGYAGGIYQAVNHGIYEAMLFLVAGYLYVTTHSLRIEELRGVGKKAPSLALFLILGVAAISGFPGLNGFIGKTLIHEGLTEVVHHSEIPYSWVFEILFILGSALTAAYSLKLLVYLVPGIYKGEQISGISPKHSRCVYLALSVLSACIIVAGILPQKVLYLLKPFLGGEDSTIQPFTAYTLLNAVKIYIYGGIIFSVFSLQRLVPVDKIISKLEGRISDVTGSFCNIKESLYNYRGGETLRGTGRFSRGKNALLSLLIFLFGAVRSSITAVDRGLNFETWLYKPVVTGLYRALHSIFIKVDRNIDALYTFCTSFLTGIYPSESTGMAEDGNCVTFQFKERGALYRRYSDAASKKAVTHIREAGRNVRKYLEDKEYKTLNLNVGVIIFAVVVVVLMLIFGLYTPLARGGMHLTG